MWVFAKGGRRLEVRWNGRGWSVLDGDEEYCFQTLPEALELFNTEVETLK